MKTNESSTRKCCKCKKTTEEVAVDTFPGAGIDVADDEKVDAAVVAERTAVLDSNPRDNN